MKEYEVLTESIRDWLKNLAEDESLPMDKRVHKILWDYIQSIDHELEQIKEVKE